jgi:hypothetical protein
MVVSRPVRRIHILALLDQRLAHEIEVIGPDFQLVGRS